MRAVTAWGLWLLLVPALLLGGATGTVAGARSLEDDEIAPPTAIADPGWAVPAPAEDGRSYWSRNLFVRVARDQPYLVKNWWPSQARDLRWTAPLLGSLAFASEGGARSGADASLQQSLSATGTGVEPLAEGLTWLGEAKVAAVGLGATYLISRWSGSERGRRVSSLSAEALINSAIYVGLLKRITQRTRPTEPGTGDFFVGDPAAGQQAASFPSGHASGAFAVAAVLAGEFRGRRWVPWVAYGTAGLIALSRVSLDRHFPSDVVVGALIGNSVGRMVNRCAGGDDASRTRGIPGTWYPVLGPAGRGAGIGWSYSW